MNRRLREITARILQNRGPIVIASAASALLLVTGGCASGQPAGVLVRHQLLGSRTGFPDEELRLKVVSYSIWGLASWMMGAGRGRDPKNANELERLDPDIILEPRQETEQPIFEACEHC